MSQTLIDPYSAVYDNWRGPSKGYMSSIGGKYFGYRICVDVNAKNRMGGYTGRHTYFNRCDQESHSNGKGPGDSPGPFS